MSAWHDGRLVAFDVETTGVDYETDRLVTASIAVVGGGEPVASIPWLIDPGVEIPEGATKVHGVTTEKVRAEGTPAADAIPAIVGMLREQVEGRALVAFNARFDLTMLDREARRYGVEPLNADRIRVVDPFVIDKWLHRFRRGSRKLDAVCEHYGARLDSAHEATADAIAAARLAWVIGKRGQVVADYPQEGPMQVQWARIRDDLDALHEAQIDWAREQAASLADYFHRKGEDQHVEPAWPVVPFSAARAAA